MLIINNFRFFIWQQNKKTLFFLFASIKGKCFYYTSVNIREAHIYIYIKGKYINYKTKQFNHTGENKNNKENQIHKFTTGLGNNFTRKIAQYDLNGFFLNTMRLLF